METIGLIAAMDMESDALLRRVKIWRTVALGALRASLFELSGRTCLLVTSGMGARRAAHAARVLVEQARPRMLISFGIAGAVETDLSIGDVVLAEATCALEGASPGPLQSLATLPDPAREAAAQALSARGARLLTGTAVTTGGAQATAVQLSHLPHPLLEMETAAISQLAAEKGIPLYAIRAISDNPRAPIPIDLGELMDADANLMIGPLLKALLRRPQALLQLPRLVQNFRLAANNAAIALVAALGKI